MLTKTTAVYHDWMKMDVTSCVISSGFLLSDTQKELVAM